MPDESRNLGFRGWFYFRTGWSNYFTFVFAAVNTLTVTYYLAIEKYPFLETIFPNFLQYIVIIVGIGIPLLVFVVVRTLVGKNDSYDCYLLLDLYYNIFRKTKKMQNNVRWMKMVLI